MQESADLRQTSGDCSPEAPAESERSLDGPALSSGKLKKRERPDQSATAGKKIQHTEACSSPQKREFAVNFVDGGGGLASTAAVDQLICKMKQGVPSSLQRSAVAKILFATSKSDCLKKFVFLGGVSTLEEWILESARIRSTDAAVVDSEKALDEEIMAILQALEKLPISLETLKGCSIGKSVKQLRSVRNAEIQKKAKKLVDTWRKRVDLEIKQTCGQPVVAVDRPQQFDAAANTSDHSPSKVTEVNNRVAAKSSAVQSQENKILVKLQTARSTASNGSPGAHAKFSGETDANGKTARAAISSFPSGAGLNPSKKHKLSSPFSVDQDCNDEASISPDYRNLKEKDTKCETSSTHAAMDVAAKKTNEYRKKLRSGGSSAPPCSTESNAITLPGNAIQSRDHTSEKMTCIDSNMGDSEQQHPELHNHCADIEAACVKASEEAPGPHGRSDIYAENNDGNASHVLVQGSKAEHMNGSCLSSQSSCSNKHNFVGANGLIMENMNLLTFPFQGAAKACTAPNLLSEQANDLSSGKDASKSLSSENIHPDVFSQKLMPKVESNPLIESLVNVLSERNGSANVAHGVEVGASDREDSCCSHNTQTYRKAGDATVTPPDQDENVEQIPTEHYPSQPSVHEAACSESTKFLSNNSQVLASEPTISTKAPFLTINGTKSYNVLGEIDRMHTVPIEFPAFTQSCHDFDLNEGLAMEEFGHEIQPSCGTPSSTCCAGVRVAGTLSAPIAVSAATKGAFIPSLDTRSKTDIGWRGSAATSAFRPAEPRHALTNKMQPVASATTGRNVNSFDLNVADHDSFEDPPLLPCQDLQEARLDLNNGDKVNQTVPSTSDSSKQLHAGSPRNCGQKRTVLDFDLNEELNEVRQEQAILPAFATKTFDRCNPYGGLAATGTGGDYTVLNSADDTFYPGPTAAIGPKIELFCPGSTIQPPLMNSRQLTPTNFVPSPSTSFVFSQTAPFFGGSQQTSFPTSLTYSSVPAGPDTSFMVSRGFPETSFMVSKAMPGTVGAPMGGVRSRAEMSVRPAFLANIDDLRGGNNFFAWGRAPQNTYGNSGATVISYNDPTVVGREHGVNVDGNVSLEEQMRIFEQAVVPVSSSKRREPEYFTGLKQTWH